MIHSLNLRYRTNERLQLCAADVQLYVSLPDISFGAVCSIDDDLLSSLFHIDFSDLIARIVN